MPIEHEKAAATPSFPARIAGTAALCLALASFGCSRDTARPSIEPIQGSGPVPTRVSKPEDTKDGAIRNPAEAAKRYGLDVYEIPAKDFDVAIANFIREKPHLRITSIEGDGNASYGRNHHFALAVRAALPGEALQTVERVNDSDATKAFRMYIQANPDREIVASAGDGNQGYGRNGYYILVTQELPPGR